MNHERPVISYPPRKIPIDFSILLVLGNFMSLFGSFFFGFGLIFVWIFGLNADYTSWYTFRKNNVVEVSGKVFKTEKTKFTEGGSSHSSGSPVYKQYYTYNDLDGLEHNGVVYSTNSRKKNVTIQYLKVDKDYSRIKGMLKKPMPPFVGFVFLFPIIGIVMAFIGFKRGIFSYYILKHGYPAEAIIIDRHSTGTRINNMPVIDFTLEFSTRNKTKYRSNFKTHHVDRMGDEDTELMLYDPYKPERAVPFDAFSTRPDIDENGNILSKNTLMAFGIFIFYVVIIAGHGYYIFNHLL